MSEADAIGWDYTEADIAKEEREQTGSLNGFELMLNYHDMSEHEWAEESGNSKSQMWWNYRKFGKGK
jgi:hypothetical protein